MATIECNHEFNGQEIEVERLIPTGDEIIGLTFQKSKEVPSLYNLAFILWSMPAANLSQDERAARISDVKSVAPSRTKYRCFLFWGLLGYPLLAFVNGIILLIKANAFSAELLEDGFGVKGHINTDFEEVDIKLFGLGMALLVCSLLTAIPLITVACARSCCAHDQLRNPSGMQCAQGVESTGSLCYYITVVPVLCIALVAGYELGMTRPSDTEDKIPNAGDETLTIHTVTVDLYAAYLFVWVASLAVFVCTGLILCCIPRFYAI